MKFHRDRRKNIDRRLKDNGFFTPERRSDKDRRSGVDLKNGVDRRSGVDRRKDFDEQRKQERVKVKKGVSVVFRKPRFFKWFKPRTEKLATITDISLGGLRAQYVAGEMWTHEFDKLSIVTDDDKIKIDNIPFKVISDFPVSYLPNSKNLRKFGVKFVELHSEYIPKLNYIIQNYTI
jgi:hypothetical protein